MVYPIADLHCDLLSYLEENIERTPYDIKALCSIPQLRQGNVSYQTLAVFVKTGSESVKKGMAQVNIYEQLPLLYPQEVIHFDRSKDDLNQSKVAILLALENASGFCSEEEPLENGLNRLQDIINRGSKPIYMSLTWNMENRFGGGASTKVGLKEDGRRLLDFLHDKKIAIDFSHTSDALAYDVFEYIDKNSLNLAVMASHSNARTITSVPRNLPDDLIKAIFSRKGIIGINFYRNFVGLEPEEYFVKHLSHLFSLGGASQICLGADFFYEEGKSQDNFFPNYSNASCYPNFLHLCKTRLNMEEQQLQALCCRNFLTFLEAQ